MYHHPYDTPTYKAKMVCFADDEGWLERLLMQYKWLIQLYLSLLWLLLAMHFVIFHPYDTLTYKTKTFRLASTKGWVKRLLLLYKKLIQPYLSLLWLLLATYFFIRAMPIDDIHCKSQLKSSHNYSTNHLQSKSHH